MTKENRKEIYEEMRASHRRWQKKWLEEGRPGNFYEWLLTKIEKKMAELEAEGLIRG